MRYDGELDVHPRVAYLALNYVDRYLSKRQLAVRTRDTGALFSGWILCRDSLLI